MIVGFFMLFFSFAFLVIFPESEHSAFPYPLGVPGIVIIVVGLVIYVISRFRKTPQEHNDPSTRGTT